MEYINDIVKILSNNKNIIFAYLFGSRIKNKIRFGSDLDLAIYFTTEPDILEIGELCNELENAININIDLVMLNDLFLHNPQLSYNILNDGTLIYSKDDESLSNYKKRVLLEYLDIKPILDMFHNKFIERLSNNKFAV